MQSNSLYQQYSPQILAYLLRFVNKSVAQDLTQEVFVKVIANLDQYKGESSVKTWIYRIASNTVKDYLRSKAYRVSKQFEPITEIELESYGNIIGAVSSVENALEDKEMNKCINEFIHRIPYNYSSILVLSDLEELNTKEVSNILDISTGAVKVRLHRARAKLKEELEAGCVISTTCDSKIKCERK